MILLQHLMQAHRLGMTVNSSDLAAVPPLVRKA